MRCLKLGHSLYPRDVTTKPWFKEAGAIVKTFQDRMYAAFTVAPHHSDFQQLFLFTR